MNKFTRKFFQEKGRKGGMKTAQRGHDYYSNLGKKAMEIRWKKGAKGANPKLHGVQD